MSTGFNPNFGLFQSFWKGTAVANLAKAANTAIKTEVQESDAARQSGSAILDEYIPSSFSVEAAAKSVALSDELHATTKAEPAASEAGADTVLEESSKTPTSTISDDSDVFGHLRSDGAYTKNQIDDKYWLNKRGIITDLDEFIQTYWDDPSIETLVIRKQARFDIDPGQVRPGTERNAAADKYFETPYEQRYQEARTKQLTQMYNDQLFSEIRNIDPEKLIKYTEGDVLTIEAGDFSVKENKYADRLLGVTFEQKQAMREDENAARAYFEGVREERAALDDRVGQLLEEAGLKPGEGESLSLNVDLNGTISVGEGFEDVEKAIAIENALNADASLGRELLLNYAKEGLKIGGNEGIAYDTDSTYGRIIANEALRSETGLTLDDIRFEKDRIRFSDKNGNVDLSSFNSDDYMVFHGLFSNFSWNGAAYEKAAPLSVSFDISFN